MDKTDAAEWRESLERGGFAGALANDAALRRTQQRANEKPSATKRQKRTRGFRGDFSPLRTRYSVPLGKIHTAKSHVSTAFEFLQ